MMIMDKDIITIVSNNEKKEYRLLAIISNQYIIYTNLNNSDITKDIHVIKVESIDNLDKIIPMTDEEYEIINKKYDNIINKKV